MFQATSLQLHTSAGETQATPRLVQCRWELCFKSVRASTGLEGGGGLQGLGLGFFLYILQSGVMGVLTGLTRTLSWVI